MSPRVAQFEALVARQPETELFRFSLAQALVAADRGADAIPHLEFCVNRKADWMLPRILLGKELLKSGQPAAARPLLESALQLAIDQDHDDPAAELRALLAGM
jgi:predicted Zn-dependent protease